MAWGGRELSCKGARIPAVAIDYFIIGAIIGWMLIVSRENGQPVDLHVLQIFFGTNLWGQNGEIELDNRDSWINVYIVINSNFQSHIIHAEW